MGEDVDYRQGLLLTYRYLRLGMAVLVLMLFVAVGSDVLATGRLLDSLSAYYYTQVHPVFVASLCATGACLVIFRGLTDVEDVLLNAAGFLAFVVAFVPTRFTEACEPDAVFCPVSEATILADLRALLITGAIALALGYVVSIRGTWAGSRSGVQRLDPAARRIYWAVVAAYLALVGFVWLAPEAFLSVGHLGAAGLLFACMLGVVWLHGRVLEARNRDAGGDHAKLRRFYWASALVMLFGGAVLLFLANWSRFFATPAPLPQAGFWLEAFLLGAFGVFWLTQTFTEVWDEPAPSGPTAPA